MDKPKKMKPHTKKWKNMAIEIAFDYAPPIYPCYDCGGPVAKGYCCTRCGSNNPEGS